MRRSPAARRAAEHVASRWMFGGFDRGRVRVARRRPAASLPIVAAALCLSAALASCGSAKPLTRAQSAEPLTRAQLVRHANALCTQVQVKMKKVGPANTTQELADVAAKLAGFEQHQLEAMHKLKPPPAMASDWKHMIEGAEEITEDAGNLSTNVQPKKKAAIEELNQVGKVEQRISPIAKHDGFKSCSQL